MLTVASYCDLSSIFHPRTMLGWQCTMIFFVLFLAHFVFNSRDLARYSFSFVFFSFVFVCTYLSYRNDVVGS